MLRGQLSRREEALCSAVCLAASVQGEELKIAPPHLALQALLITLLMSSCSQMRLSWLKREHVQSATTSVGFCPAPTDELYDSGILGCKAVVLILDLKVGQLTIVSRLLCCSFSQSFYFSCLAPTTDAFGIPVVWVETGKPTKRIF